jgi:phosphohistidine phosphatase
MRGGTNAPGRGSVAPDLRIRPITALRQLLLLRHAKSLWDDPKLSDHARPLNARGRASARAMRVAMHDLGLSPDLVLVSSARRALQTLEALAPWDEAPLIEPMDALYLATSRTMLDVLRDVAETVRSVLLIGHNPGMHELAMTLVGAHAFTQSAVATGGEATGNPAHGTDAHMLERLAEGYPTGALAEFSVAGPWALLGDGGGRLLRFLSPRDLPEVVL